MIRRASSRVIEFKNVPLAVADRNYLGVWQFVRQLARPAISFDPAVAFFFLNGQVPAIGSLPEVLVVAEYDVRPKHSQWKPLFAHDVVAVHVKSPPRFVIERTEIRDGLHGCEIQLGGILDGHDTILSGASFDNHAPVRSDQFPGLEIAVVEKAAGGDDLTPSSA